jgi:hypothetical protein
VRPAKAAKCNRVPDTAPFLSALATLVPVFLIVTKFLPFSLLAPRWYSGAVDRLNLSNQRPGSSGFWLRSLMAGADDGGQVVIRALSQDLLRPVLGPRPLSSPPSVFRHSRQLRDPGRWPRRPRRPKADPHKLNVERLVAAALLLTVPTEAVGRAGRRRAQSSPGGGRLVCTSTAAGIVAALQSRGSPPPCPIARSSSEPLILAKAPPV